MGEQLLIQVLGRLLSITEIFWSRTWALPCVGLRRSSEKVRPCPPQPLGPPNKATGAEFPHLPHRGHSLDSHPPSLPTPLTRCPPPGAAHVG